ncbi:hypothetical protein chiPu_0026949, partial [Chiloscyllium punctatum]|nr:hypothetical protein [Chiloscyllium punctatum]
RVNPTWGQGGSLAFFWASPVVSRPLTRAEPVRAGRARWRPSLGELDLHHPPTTCCPCWPEGAHTYPSEAGREEGPSEEEEEELDAAEEATETVERRHNVDDMMYGRTMDPDRLLFLSMREGACGPGGRDGQQRSPNIQPLPARQGRSSPGRARNVNRPLQSRDGTAHGQQPRVCRSFSFPRPTPGVGEGNTKCQLSLTVTRQDSHHEDS